MRVTEEKDRSSTRPPGFTIILVFHSLCGVSYFGLLSSLLLRVWTIIVSTAFAVSLILLSLPCVLNCSFRIQQLMTWGLSPAFLSFCVIILDVYHAVMSCLIIAFRSRRLREFFERSEDYCQTFGLQLLPAQRTKLTAVAVKLVCFNVLHVILEACFLTLVVPHKLLAGVVRSNKEQAATEENPVLFPGALVVRLMSVLFSKVIESNLVYLIEYVALVVQRLEMKYDKFIYRTSHASRSIEVGKVAFIEIQNLIREADEVFSHAAFDPLFVDVLITLLGILEFCDGITRRRKISADDCHELFNAFASLISIYLCCKSEPFSCLRLSFAFLDD